MPNSIPKIIHQVWVDPRPPLTRLAESWKQQNPDWEYMLHTPDSRAIRKTKGSDRLRAIAKLTHKVSHEMLHKHGGFYCDMYSWCLESLDPILALAKDGLLLFKNHPREGGGIDTAFFGCAPQHSLADYTGELHDHNLFHTMHAAEWHRHRSTNWLLNECQYLPPTKYTKHSIGLKLPAYGENYEIYSQLGECELILPTPGELDILRVASDSRYNEPVSPERVSGDKPVPRKPKPSSVGTRPRESSEGVIVTHGTTTIRKRRKKRKKSNPRHHNSREEEEMNLRKKFAKGWTASKPETICGWGSKKKHTKHIREALQEILKELGIESMNDAGCGDLNWILQDDLPDYVGYDLVRRPKWKTCGFPCYELNLVEEVMRPCDLIFTRDVLQHLTDDMVIDAIGNMRKSGKYLLATTHPGATMKRLPPPKGGPIDMSLPKYGLGEPVKMVFDKAAATLYPETFMGLWQLNDERPLEIETK